jgi:hypothetical protein
MILEKEIVALLSEADTEFAMGQKEASIKTLERAGEVNEMLVAERTNNERFAAALNDVHLQKFLN